MHQYITTDKFVLIYIITGMVKNFIEINKQNSDNALRTARCNEQFMHDFQYSQ